MSRISILDVSSFLVVEKIHFEVFSLQSERVHFAHVLTVGRSFSPYISDFLTLSKSLLLVLKCREFQFSTSHLFLVVEKIHFEVFSLQSERAHFAHVLIVGDFLSI